MALDYQSLLSNADVAGYRAAARPTIAQLLKLALLRSIAKTSNPMAALDYQSLVSGTNVPGYRAAGATSEVQLLELALLNLIAGGSGGGAIVTGTGSPVGVVTPTLGTLYYDTVAKNLWAADGTVWNNLV